MYKRPKRSFTGSFVVGRPACVSTGNRDNIVDESSKTNSPRTSDSQVAGKGRTQITIPIPPVFEEPTVSDNIVELFSSCGMDIENEPSHVLKTDQAVFIRSLTSKLFYRRNSVPDTVTWFMEKFKEHYSSQTCFSKALSFTTTSSDCDIARGSTQDSLVRLLLQIQELQYELSNYLLDKLAELGLQNNETDSEMTPITWVKLTLQPFRYLNSIVNSKHLCERLFDIIFSSSDRVIQQEVIICLPDIVADSEHHFVATELSKLLKCELELMPPILDALANLNIHKDIKRSVRDSLISTLQTSPIEHLPNIVKYLLCTCESDSFDELINNLRKELFAENSVSMKHTIVDEDVDPINIQVLLFSNIRSCLLANKQLADAWTRNISQSNATTKNRPLDMIISIILYDICAETSRKRNLETLIRNRIKSEFFNVPSIDETFEHFGSVIIEYFPSLLSILAKLLKSSESCIKDFVTAFYLACFENIEIQQSKIILRELLAYIGAGDANDAQTALNILSTITMKHPNKMKSAASMLRILLNKLGDLSLNDVQLSMNILCFLAFSELGEENGTIILKDDITKLIEKNMSSPNIKSLRIGIIATVTVIKYVASCAEDESNERSEISSEDFDETSLREKGKRARPFLRLVIDGTLAVPEAQGFAFDQLALMLMQCRNIDKSLLMYTSGLMKTNLRNYFLICTDEIKNVELVECSVQFNLIEDDEQFVVLNLTPNLVEELSGSVSIGVRLNTVVLPSLFRLLRGLEYEDLNAIDGLLECPALIPSPKVFDDFALQPADVQTVIMDSLFHLTNWFREVVSCFARMVKQPVGKKVLIRLRTLIWLQNMIAKYLPLMLVRDYCPPKCHFHKDVRPPTVGIDRGKKKPVEKKQKKDKATDIRKHLVSRDGTQPQTTIMDESDDELKENEGKTADLKNYKNFFRELDLDIWFMLMLPLTMSPAPENNWEFSAEFGPAELVFIMEDLVEKIHFILVTSTKKNPFRNTTSLDIGLTSGSLYVGNPEIIVRNMIKLVPRLCSHLKELSGYCQKLLTNNDHVLDSTGMFLAESRDIKTCYALILKALYILFTWSGFETPDHAELFTTALVKMTTCVESSSRSQSKLIMIRECVTYLTNFQDTVLHLDCAVNLVTLVEILAKRSEQREVNKILGKMCWNFLSHHWYNWDGCEEKGATFNKSIEYLITTFFNCSLEKLKAVSSMCEWLKTEITTLNNRDSSLTTLPNINKGNCYVLLRVLLKVLATATKEALDNVNDAKEKLEIWLKLMKNMESIVTVLKIQPARVNLISFVKGSASILRLFLTYGINVCSQKFRTESTTVSQILKTLQITTRYLQKIFDNTRVTADSTLCSYMPSIRSLLESILLKVKNIMVINGCTEAFFVGSMRNKDLQGQDILSQTTINTESERMDIDEDDAISNVQGSEIEENSSTGPDNSDELSNENDNKRDVESDVILSDDNDSD